jgi:hypothetical protein
MTIYIRRGELISLLGGTVVTWPLAARAEQRAMPVIGFLHPGSSEKRIQHLAAFRLQ